MRTSSARFSVTRPNPGSALIRDYIAGRTESRTGTHLPELCNAVWQAEAEGVTSTSRSILQSGSNRTEVSWRETLPLARRFGWSTLEAEG
jgi:hypothetical protein